MIGQRPVAPHDPLLPVSSPRVLGNFPGTRSTGLPGPAIWSFGAMPSAAPIDLASVDIPALELPLSGERVVRDSCTAGLGLRLRASGARTWVLFSREAGRTVRRTLGDPDIISVELARRMCAMPSADPTAEASVAKHPLSSRVDELVEHFLAVGEKGRWKMSTLRNMRSAVSAHILPALGTRKVRDITPQEVARWYQGVIAKSSAARMALSTLSGLMLYAEDHGLRPIGSNPCQGLRKKQREHRGQTLTKSDVRRLWVTLDRVQPHLRDACDAIRLLLLTGARRTEILALEWDRIVGQRAVLEDSKSGPRTIWLNTAARAILDGRRETASGCFVFPNAKGTGPIKTIDREWAAICSQARLDGIRVHDLRHHFASIAVSNGIDLRIVGQLLGHHDLDSTLTYAHLAKGSLVQSATRVSGLIDAAMRGRENKHSSSRPPVRTATARTESPAREAPHA